MASIKLKFRPSACKGKEGTLFFQLIQGRTVRRMRSKFRIFNEEWDSAAGQIVLPQHPSPQADRLSLIRSNVELELRVLEDIVADLDLDGDTWDADEAVERFMMSRRIDGSVFHFMENQIQRKLKLGRLRSAETYQTTLNSFMGFRKGVDLTFSMIDSAMMQLYEAAMRSRGLSRNTTSFYMRIMRTNYRMAVEEGLTDDKRPFRHVYCGIDKTVKRSITFADIKRIKDLDLSQRPVMAFARDMFIFLKSATKLFSVLLASKRPLITELADKLRLKYPLLPTISPCPTMRLEAIRSIIPISCRRYPKSV